MAGLPAMVGAHASFTMEEDSLAGCVDLAQRLGVGVHIHAAEDPVDERITRERFGCGLDRAISTSRAARRARHDSSAHGTHFSDADFAAVNERGDDLSLAHNPSSNMNNGVGYTPVAKLRKPPLLGTDGIGADMWREARMAEFKSHDAGLPLPFGAVAGNAGRNRRGLRRNALGVKLGVLEAGRGRRSGAHQLPAGHAADSDNLASHFLVRDGAGICAKRDDWPADGASRTESRSRATKQRFEPMRRAWLVRCTSGWRQCSRHTPCAVTR